MGTAASFRPLVASDGAAFRRLLFALDDATPYMLFEPGERRDDGDEGFGDKIRGFADGGTAIGAFVGDELVGYLSARGGGARRIAHAVHLVLGVVPTYQGRGVGTGLMAEVESWAWAEGYTRLELTVVTVNEPAVALYRKAGFTVEGTLRSTLMIDGQPHDEYAMAKLLP